MDCLSGGLSGDCMGVEGKYFELYDTGEGAISIVYSDIHVQPYAISGQKCLVGTRNNPLLCTVNDTEYLRRKALKPGL